VTSLENHSDVINDTWTRADYIISYRDGTKNFLLAENYFRKRL
jgi:hypothetical protein